jgi:hypothetical protein
VLVNSDDPRVRRILVVLVVVIVVGMMLSLIPRT